MTPEGMNVRAVTMRPIANADDSFAAASLFAQALMDDSHLAEIFPEDGNAKPVAIAEDGTAAAFDLYPGPDTWPHLTGKPIARVVVFAHGAEVSAA
jgi:hypothetical protein